jgi:transglutaminase-like putative cysteine protease
VVRYQILLEPLQDASALFGPFRIRGISGFSRNLLAVDRDSDDSVYMRSSGSRIQYEVISEVPRLARLGDANASGAESGNGSPKYLQLPEDTDPRVRELAAEITRNATSPLEKAVRVEAFLKRNYQYSLLLDWDPGAQPVSAFLLSAKRGHCEYFASSMAILLRAAGVGTRVVNGFLMGEYNSVGDHYLVRQSDAHSWVEVFIPGAGWREFDPTPPDPQRGDVGFTGRISQYVDAMEMFWNSYVLIYDTEAQMQLFRNAQDRALALQNGFRDWADAWMVQIDRISQRFAKSLGHAAGAWWFWLAPVAIAVLVALFPKRRALLAEIRMRRVRRGLGTPDRAIIEHMFYRAADLARGKGPRREPSQTWREWIVGLSDANRRSLLESAAAVFERSKYGCDAASADDFALLERTLRELRGAAR